MNIFFQNEYYENKFDSSHYERIIIGFDSIIEIFNCSKLSAVFNVAHVDGAQSYSGRSVLRTLHKVSVRPSTHCIYMTGSQCILYLPLRKLLRSVKFTIIQSERRSKVERCM